MGKELKKLSRRELVEIIYQMKKNEQQMQEEIESLQEQLRDKRIRLTNAGSIAEAAASITNVFSAAQATADLYLHEILYRKEETEKECAKMLEETNAAVAKIIADREQQLNDLSARYEEEYKKLQLLQEEMEETKQMKKQDFCEE